MKDELFELMQAYSIAPLEVQPRIFKTIESYIRDHERAVADYFFTVGRSSQNFAEAWDDWQRQWGEG